MIESIEFKNFKALKDTTLPLSPFTLIIGPNGSGKSTALQALKAVGQRQHTSFQSIATKGLPITDETSAEVSISWGEPYMGVRTSALWFLNNRALELDHRSPYGVSQNAKTSINEILTKICIYSFDAKAIATSTELKPGIRLKENGSNLAGVLDRLRDNEPERFESLNEEVGGLLPEFDRILFDTPGEGTRAILLRTREGQHKIPANALSEGTLLALALLTLAYIPDPPPIICIEEPDRGIHPRLLRDVSDALNRLAYPESVGEKRQPVQVIATTHSPYFLDMYKDFPEQVVITNKIGQEVKFERLSDRPHYEDIIQDASLGDAWYTGIFGGVPAHP